jgi:hypothetical protein
VEDQQSATGDLTEESAADTTAVETEAALTTANSGGWNRLFRATAGQSYLDTAGKEPNAKALSVESLHERWNSDECITSAVTFA